MKNLRLTTNSVVRYGQESTIRQQLNSTELPAVDQQLTLSDLPPWLVAVRGAEAKKAQDIRVLDLRPITTFADHFIICTGSNARQIQAIANEIGMRLRALGEWPVNVEGYENAEWVLADYGDYLIHIFSEQARSYYDLERLWRDAKPVPIPVEEETPQVVETE